jgi:hypothetical protein
MFNTLAPLIPEQRRELAYQIRVRAASVYRTAPIPAHPNNGDEARYPHKIASFSKGLAHNSKGEVDLAAYQTLIDALSSGQPEVFERIPLGCNANSRKFVNPQAGLAFDLEGADSHLLAIRPAPRFESAETAAEIVENYWMAILRDIPFDEYPNNDLAKAAAEELSGLVDFKGSRDPATGKVTPQTLFRGITPGDLQGPYLSQFLIKNVPFGAGGWQQVMLAPKANIDFMTTFEEWLAVQNGCQRHFKPTDFHPHPVHIRNGRALSQWVHIDVLFQAYFQACLMLLADTDAPTPVGGGIKAQFDAGNPYLTSLTQEGFGTFGPPFYIGLLSEVATRALKAVWFQKWFVHRRLRPEAFAGRVHRVKTGQADYPIHPQVLNSEALQAISDRYHTYLLPQAFPEGSPLHPAYGAGHATVAGACVTILKALFDETMEFPNPMQVVATPTDTRLVPYSPPPGSPPLTVGGELNKLASNVAIGRNIAGVHWRSDATESLFLGEEIAISILRDQKLTFNETFGGWHLTRFDGRKVLI